jgi:hypothetical protein
MIDGGLWGVLREHWPHVDKQRVETGGTGLGIPDVNACLAGVEVWLELKGTEAWAVAIRPEQVAWAERRTRAGGRVLLLTRRRCAAGPRRVACDELWIHRATDIRHVSALGLRGGPPPLHRSDGGPSNWLWPVIEEVVFGP